MGTLIDSVLAMEDRRKAEQDAAFRQLVDDAANDRVSADEISAILQATGRTSAELATAVRHQRTLAEHRQTIRQARAARDEIESLRCRVKAVDDELAAARRRHSEAIRPLQDRIASLTTIKNRAAEAKRELRKSPPPSIQAELEEHRAKMADFERQELSLKARLHQARNNLVAGVEQNRPDVANFAENVDAIEAALKSLRDSKAEFAAIEAEIFERLYAGD